MQIRLKKRLNIFIDETGEFGFSKKSSKLYGISMVLHEQDANITQPLAVLDQKFADLNFHSMVHIGDLVAGHEDFKGMDVSARRKIYTCLYRFSTQANAKYHTIIIEKHHSDTSKILSNAIRNELSAFIISNLSYLQQFDELVVYYDGGQAQLGKIIDKLFGKFRSYDRRSEFDHTEKKLFQVADMLTYIDKLVYKYNNNLKFSKTEQRFFSIKNIKTIVRELRSHRI